MKLTKLSILALAMVVAALWGGCKNSAPDGPLPNVGSTAVSKYVALGNSLTAGYQSNALYASAQVYSYPNLIAQQLNLSGATLGSFEQPLYGDPGNADPKTGKSARYELIAWNVSSTTGQPNPIVASRNLTPGAPTNSSLPRGYDNLGVPGAIISDVIDTTAVNSPSRRGNPFFQLVLRTQFAGKSLLQQAVRLNPDLVTFWLGNNDVLGFATSGGVSPSTPTPLQFFTGPLTLALQTLRGSLPNAKIVVGNIPNVTAIPFFTTVGPKIASGLPAGLYLRYQKHGVTGPSFDSTRFAEANPPLACLTGAAYATLLGQPTGKWYRDNGYPALPAGIDTTKPFGFHPQNPWPDALMLDADEQTTAANAVQAFNSAIATAAAAVNGVVVDMNGFFAQVKAQGYHTPGQTFTADYIKGGLFSYDGVHPSSKGAGVVANVFIDKINASFGMNIMKVDITTIPAIAVPLAKAGGDVMPEIPPDAFGELKMLWGE